MSTVLRIAATASAALLMAALTVPVMSFQPPAQNGEGTETAQADDAAAATELVGDPERGKTVFQRVGNCTYCHGWAGDGVHGKHPRSPGIAANLRESQLAPEDMMAVVRCGIPGTAMPYHVSQAYKDPEICYGLTLEDFAEDDLKPVRGKTFREKDVANVVAYIQQTFQGRGEVTLEECEEILEPGNSACDFLR